MLKISNQLSLPVDAVTQAFAILGRRGSGKTNTAVVMAEEMLAGRFPIAVLDPLGVWFGLRSSPDGKSAGYPIVIFGGEHRDVPLEPTAGKVVADFIVAERLSVILDVSAFGENEMRRFVADFAKQFYRINREAIHLFVDEADEFAPQSPYGGPGAECLGAMQNIVRRGRSRGIGVTLISQRSAVLNKSVLTQAECLIAMQTTGPQDLKAIDDWIKYHGTAEERDQIMRSLTKLQTGQGWFYSPAWLKVLKQVKVRARETFDSSRTPKPGEAKREPKRLADVDLAKIEKQMAATVERAKADDPKLLRKQIADLQQQLKAKGAAADPKAIEAAEVRGYERGKRDAAAVEKQLRAAIGDREGRLTKIERLAHLNGEALAVPPTRPTQNLTTSRELSKAPKSAANIKLSPKPPETRANYARPDTRPAMSIGDVSSAAQKLLDAIAWWRSIGVDRPSKLQMAFAAGYTFNGHVRNSLGALRTAGLIEYPSGNCVALTASGIDVANHPDSAPTLAEFQSRIRAKLDTAQLKLFDVLLNARAAGEGPLENEDFAGRAGYTFNGHVRNVRGSLRSLGLIEYIAGGQQASDLVFPEALA